MVTPWSSRPEKPTFDFLNISKQECLQDPFSETRLRKGVSDDWRRCTYNLYHDESNIFVPSLLTNKAQVKLFTHSKCKERL